MILPDDAWELAKINTRSVQNVAVREKQWAAGLRMEEGRRWAIIYTKAEELLALIGYYAKLTQIERERASGVVSGEGDVSQDF